MRCLACTNNCKNCSGTTDSCIACDQTSPYKYWKENTCVDSCTAGFYATTIAPFVASPIIPTFQESHQACLPCHVSCATCNDSGEDSCSICASNYYQKTGNLGRITCHVETDCGTGFFPNTSTGTCDACSSPCNECETTSTNCTSCGTGLFLLNGTCVSDCGNGYFAGPANTCVPCDPSCLTCSNAGPNSCSTCSPGKYYGGMAECIDCNICGPIVDGAECSGATTCTKCRPYPADSGLRYLNPNDDTCNLECPAGSFKDDSDPLNPICSNCYPHCTTCGGPD